MSFQSVMGIWIIPLRGHLIHAGWYPVKHGMFPVVSNEPKHLRLAWHARRSWLADGLPGVLQRFRCFPFCDSIFKSLRDMPVKKDTERKWGSAGSSLVVFHGSEPLWTLLMEMEDGTVSERHQGGRSMISTQLVGNRDLPGTICCFFNCLPRRTCPFYLC